MINYKNYLFFKRCFKDKVWGKVFEITGEENVNKTLEKLDAREYSYTRDEANVFFKDSSSANNETSVCAVVYFANTKHKNFVEQEALTETAEVIARSRGMMGHNVELFRVIDWTVVKTNTCPS